MCQERANGFIRLPFIFWLKLYKLIVAANRKVFLSKNLFIPYFCGLFKEFKK